MPNHDALSELISHEVSMTCVGDDPTDMPELPVTMGYDPQDPYAVSFGFGPALGDGEHAATWTFGRDLLLEGITAPTGIGDVYVWPCLDVKGCATVVIELRSPSGEVSLQASTVELNEFLHRTLDAVAAGTETDHLDLDDADNWLAGLAGCATEQEKDKTDD